MGVREKVRYRRQAGTLLHRELARLECVEDRGGVSRPVLRLDAKLRAPVRRARSIARRRSRASDRFGRGRLFEVHSTSLPRRNRRTRAMPVPHQVSDREFGQAEWMTRQLLPRFSNGARSGGREPDYEQRVLIELLSKPL